MTETDPKILIQDLLYEKWDATNTSLTEMPNTHTGWYDHKSGKPQITITDRNEITLNGGSTGVSASSGTGGKVQIRQGTVLVNGWSGTRENIDINPKQMSWELGKEIERIMRDYRIEEFNSLAAESVQEMTDDHGPEIIFRDECTVVYTYVKRGAN